MENKSARGVGLILCAAVLWGTTGTAQSFAPLSLSSYWVGALRLLVAGLFFLVWLGIKEPKALRLSQIRSLPWRLILLAATSIAVYNLAFFAGIRATSVAVGTAIALGSGPVWAGIIQAVAFGQKPSNGWWLGVAIAVLGLVVATTGSDELAGFSIAGLSLCLVSGLTYALYALATKRILTVASASVSTAAVFTLAALIALPLAWGIAGQPQVRSDDVAILLWLGVIATGIAYLLFSVGLKYVSSATGVALALGEPIAAVCFAIAIVGERPGLLTFFGLSMVLVGLGVLVRSEIRSPSAHLR